MRKYETLNVEHLVIELRPIGRRNRKPTGDAELDRLDAQLNAVHHLEEAILPEVVALSQEHRCDVRFTYEGVVMWVRYQQHALACAYHYAKTMNEDSAVG